MTSSRNRSSYRGQSKPPPYLWLRQPRSDQTGCPVDPERLRQHFASILTAEDSVPLELHAQAGPWPETVARWRRDLAANFSIAEVHEAIQHLPDHKACGNDLIYNENLKEAQVLIPCWTDLLNSCLSQGRLPPDWSSCVMIVIPKGKGSPSEPSSYRGICKKSCVYKLLASLLTQRLQGFLESVEAIPDEQHGFRKSRSTFSAGKLLLNEIDLALNGPNRAPLYTIFIDFKSAFDLGSRKLVLERLAKVGVPERVLQLLKAILQKNLISIDDGVCERDGLEQTTGFAQGDNLSPLLFSVLIGDLPSTVSSRHPAVKMILYADDIAMYSRSRFHLQQALVTLANYIRGLGLVINVKKTEAMKFRRGGRLAAKDTFHLQGSEIKFVSNFTYLGISLGVTGFAFRRHIEERTRKAMVAASIIKNPQKLSMRVANRLFDIKVAPSATYGAPLIWGHLSCNDFMTLEKCKAAFLKRVMGLHVSTRNRLVYLLADTPLLVEDLQRTFKLPPTTAFKEFIKEWESKMAEIDPDFLTSTAMTSSDWRSCNYPTRHLITRLAVHGFHHAVCSTESFHEPGEDCRCKHCDQPCARYHVGVCGQAPPISKLGRV